MNLTDYAQNPVILWNHNFDTIPVCKVIDTKLDMESLSIEIEISQENYDRFRKIFGIDNFTELESEPNPLLCRYCGAFLPEGIGYKCPNCGACEIIRRTK